MPTRHLQVDRMVLEVSGVSAEAARRIALETATLLAEAGALPQAGDIPALRVELAAARVPAPDALAQHVIGAALRQLRGTP
jgi:hypothetical protein